MSTCLGLYLDMPWIFETNTILMTTSRKMGKSACTQPTCGVKHSCPLSPLLFSLLPTRHENNNDIAEGVSGEVTGTESVHARTRACTHARNCARTTQRLTHTHIPHTHTHTHTYTHHTHTYMQARSVSCMLYDDDLPLLTYEPHAVQTMLSRLTVCARNKHLITRVGQNHIYTEYIRYFWQGNHQIYGHIRCIYTVLANPTHYSLSTLLCLRLRTSIAQTKTPR